MSFTLLVNRTNNLRFLTSRLTTDRLVLKYTLGVLIPAEKLLRVRYGDSVRKSQIRRISIENVERYNADVTCYTVQSFRVVEKHGTSL